MNPIPRLSLSSGRRVHRSPFGPRSLRVQFPMLQPHRICLPIEGDPAVLPWSHSARRLRRNAWMEYLCAQRWGRVLLHVLVLVRKRRDVHWHLRAIAREFRRHRP